MVSEIQTEDDEMMDQLLKQGFLPLNTPVEKLGETCFSFPPKQPSDLFSSSFCPDNLCVYLANLMIHWTVFY